MRHDAVERRSWDMTFVRAEYDIKKVLVRPTRESPLVLLIHFIGTCLKVELSQAGQVHKYRPRIDTCVSKIHKNCPSSQSCTLDVAFPRTFVKLYVVTYHHCPQRECPCGCSHTWLVVGHGWQVRRLHLDSAFDSPQSIPISRTRWTKIRGLCPNTARNQRFPVGFSGKSKQLQPLSLLQ